MPFSIYFIIPNVFVSPYYTLFNIHTNHEYKSTELASLEDQPLTEAIVKKLLTITEASEKLKMLPTTIYKYVSAKRIPFTKLVGHLRFDEDELDKWIEENSSHVIKTGIRKAS